MLLLNFFHDQVLFAVNKYHFTCINILLCSHDHGYKNEILFTIFINYHIFWCNKQKLLIIHIACSQGEKLNPAGTACLSSIIIPE